MIERIEKCLDDESFKFRALSAGAVMAFDGQTEINSLPSNLPTFRTCSLSEASRRDCKQYSMKCTADSRTAGCASAMLRLRSFA